MNTCVMDDAPPDAPCDVPIMWPPKGLLSCVRGRRTGHGRVLDVRLAENRVTLDVRYMEEAMSGRCYYPPSPYRPLTITIPTEMPDWCLQIGAGFEYIYIEGQNRRVDFETNPLAMRNFGVPFLWWASAIELTHWVDARDPMPCSERASIMAREPVRYTPSNEDVEKARLQLRQWARLNQVAGVVSL